MKFEPFDFIIILYFILIFLCLYYYYRYNPVHDELIGTASSDGQVHITRLVGISSSAIENEDVNTKVSIEDKIIATCDQHEDSVYCVEWSAANSWILASLSYDGRLLLNKVPKDEQLRILL